MADVLRRRFGRLPEETVSTLRVAAVIGRDVDTQLLVRAAEIDEDAVLDALEAGVISGLLVEPAPGAVRFSHLLVRETLTPASPPCGAGAGTPGSPMRWPSCTPRT